MNILIVDDSPSNRKLLRAILEAENLTVFEAADGVEALAVMEREKIVAVISDILMPRMDGYRLCLELRSSDKFAATPFIFYTSTYTSPSDEKTAIEMGADDFLKKPSPVAEIIQALHNAVESAPRRQSKTGGPPPELDLMKEYNARLVAKLEKKNEELQARTESLQQSELHKRAILDSAIDCIIGMDHEGRIIEFNPAAEKTFGYARVEVVGREMAELIIPQALRERHRQGLARLLVTRDETYTGRRLEMNAQRRDGTEFPVELTITRVAGVEPPMFTGFVRDITGRKLAEEQLRLQAVALEAAANAIMVTDRNGAILWVNPAFETLTGYSAADAIGQSPRLLKSGKHGQGFYRHLWDTVLSGQTWQGEFTNRRKDGSLFWGEQTITPVMSETGAITHFIGIMNDVTERRQAERDLHAMHQRLRHLLAHSPALIYESRLDTLAIVPRLKSENAAALFGFTVEESNQPDWWSANLHPDDRPPAMAALRSAVEEGRSHIEYRFRHKDGTFRWVEDSKRLVRDAAGRPQAIVGVWLDITERKQAELHAAAFSNLGLRLSSAKTAQEAAEIILGVADTLFGWDACTLDLYSPEKDRVYNVLNKDTIDGLRVDCPANIHDTEPPPLTRRTIEEGGRLILQDPPDSSSPGTAGEAARPSASIMLAPIRDRSKVIGVLSIRSYRPKAYNPQDLNTLQSLADHCGGALNRIQAEAGLHESEGRFRQLAENIHEVFWVTSVDWTTVLYVSPAYEKVWGRTCAGLYADPGSWVEATVEDDRPIHQAATGKSRQGESFQCEYRIRRPDGEVRWICDRGFPVRDSGGRLVRVVGVAEDITQRKRVEQRLTTHHAVTRALAESSTLLETARKILPAICQQLEWDIGGLWIVERKTTRLHCVEFWHPPSREFETLAALSRVTALAMGEGLPGRVWKSGQPAWVPDLAGEPDFPGRPKAIEIGLHAAIAFPIKLRGETLGVIELLSAQVRPPDDDLAGMFATVGSQIGQFIERKQMEEQFRQGQKMEAFGQLAGGVAHDFNNILSVILGYTNLLICDADLSPEVNDQLKQIYTAGERAANLTRQLLTFSRKKQMEVSALDLNAVIGNMTKMFGRIIGEDIKLQCNFSGHLPSIEADEGMMEQVVMNLAVNARDAMPKGGQLIIGTDPVRRDAACVRNNTEARAGEFVCLSMRDTGCGMTSEVKARIFEPFFTTKGVGHGTGLGLATVYGIVQQHRGWIEVESQVGTGTTFKIFLPARPGVAAAAEPAAPETRVRGGNETILLVEDEATVRSLAKIILQRYGYRVWDAASGVEALNVWKELGSKIDLLLTDMVMPDGITGRELAKQLRARKPDLKVIYTSGYSMDLDGTAFRLKEAATFLQKPYHPLKLAQAVRKRLDGEV
jgi:PAS domain S-box-containing protein